MKLIIKSNIILLIAALAIAACSHSPAQMNDNNSVETQKENAAKAQRELSSETSR